MTQIVGAVCLSGACLADGRGAGLMPDPAVEAFAERPASGTPEQPPVCSAPVSAQVMAEQADKLRRDGYIRIAPSGRSLGGVADDRGAEAGRRAAHVPRDRRRRGLRPGRPVTGSGLQGMRDRLAALGGSLTVGSAPGRGTTVSGVLSCEPAIPGLAATG